MQDLQKFLSLAPVIAIVWLVFTSTLVILVNNVYPDLLYLHF
ncbi:MAG: Photosystem I reaction center subunit IX [Coleofasciculaceae cyanobacterium SM2_3_26]|nr:Photosystem I reaction center subunit IX [Coleofasciculaceae cyanobacterium SM2_3_26]